MKKRILTITLLGSVIFGFQLAQSKTISDFPREVERQIDPQVQCAINATIRGEQMRESYSGATVDRLIAIEVEKCADGSHSSL